MSRPPKRGIESLLSECCCLPSPSQSWQRSGTHTALMAKHHHSGKHPHKAELRASIHQPLLCTVTQEQGCKRKIVKKIPKTKSTTKQPPYATADNEEEKALSIIPPSVKLVLLMSARSFPMAGGRLLSWAIVKTTHGQSWTESSQFSEKAHRHSHFIANPERSENLVRSRSEAILVMLKAALLNSRKLTQKSGKVFRNISRTEHHQETARQHLWTLLAWSSVQPLVFSFGHS